jgi:hypothetical protein
MYVENPKLTLILKPEMVSLVGQVYVPLCGDCGSAFFDSPGQTVHGYTKILIVFIWY